MKLVSNALSAVVEVKRTFANHWVQLVNLVKTSGHFLVKDDVVTQVISEDLLASCPTKATKILRGMAAEVFLEAKGGVRTWTGDTMLSFIDKMREDRADMAQTWIPSLHVNGQVIAARIYFSSATSTYFLSFEDLEDSHASTTEELEFINRLRQVYHPLCTKDGVAENSPVWDAISDLGLTAELGWSRQNQVLSLVKTKAGEHRLKLEQKPITGSVAITAI